MYSKEVQGRNRTTIYLDKVLSFFPFTISIRYYKAYDHCKGDKYETLILGLASPIPCTKKEKGNPWAADVAKL